MKKGLRDFEESGARMRREKESTIKIHRKIIDKAFYCKDSEKVHLWIHLLLKANHKKNEEIPQENQIPNKKHR